jgi:hypothetical protein
MSAEEHKSPILVAKRCAPAGAGAEAGTWGLVNRAASMKYIHIVNNEVIFGYIW